MLMASNQPTGGGIAGADRARPDLLDVKQTAGVINASTRTVYRLTDAGKMPRPVKLGALVRWRRDELAAWIAEGCPAVDTKAGGGQ